MKRSVLIWGFLGTSPNSKSAKSSARASPTNHNTRLRDRDVRDQSQRVVVVVPIVYDIKKANTALLSLYYISKTLTSLRYITLLWPY